MDATQSAIASTSQHSNASLVSAEIFLVLWVFYAIAVSVNPIVTLRSR